MIHVSIRGAVILFLVSTLQAAGATPRCVPGIELDGDYDRRGDVALFDARALTACLGGPGRRVNPPSPFDAQLCLSAFDFDSDGDIDLRDVLDFKTEFTGRCIGLTDCPAGTHLVHVGGEVGIPDIDTFEPSDADARVYRCVPNGDCERRACSSRGQCRILGGQAVCGCDPGYAGQDCETCAVGYERETRTLACVLGSECRERRCSGQGDCLERDGEIVCDCDSGASGRFCENGGGGTALRAPTYVVISGTNSSIPRGQTRTICAELFGGPTVDQGVTWSLDGPGALTEVPLSRCITFIAPTFGPPHRGELTRLRACSQNFPDQCADRYIVIDPPGGIASTGQAHAVLEPFDHIIRRYMLNRCVGGAIFGVSLFGEPIMVRGFGSLSGAPTNDPEYLARCQDTYDVSHVVPGYTLPNPTPVQPNSAFRIGSISKCVGAAMLRKAVKEFVLDGGNPADDEEVEALKLCENAQILPPGVADVMCFGDPPPAPISTVSGFLPNCDDGKPCPYGGECVPTDGKSGTGTCENCPPGFSGIDCSRQIASCPNLSAQVDERWEDVTLGHLMGHRSGLPRSVPDADAIIIPRLFQHRSLMTETEWQDQEDLITSETGFPNGTFAAEFPAFPDAKDQIGDGNYFVPVPTFSEAILTRLGSCLLFTPGGVIPDFGFDDPINPYSNTAYAFVGAITEAITGKEISAGVGRPEFHIGSYLQEFAAEELGLPLLDQGTPHGIFSLGGVFRHRPANTPVFRHWDDGQQTYYPLFADGKRPYCEWDGADCRFNDWRAGAVRHDWDFEDRGSLPAFTGGSSGGVGTEGGFYTEAEIFLRFMAKYWVGGASSSNNDPLYGETRCPNGDCIWTKFMSHNGSLDGVWAESRQLGGMSNTGVACDAGTPCPTYTACAGTAQFHLAQQVCLGSGGTGTCFKRNEYYIPPLDPVSGLPTDDFVNLECHSCRLPVGVDLFIAFNQDADPLCVEAEARGVDHPFYYSCSTAYGQIVSHLYHAACQIDWPTNPYQVWPPVTQAGGSTMSPAFQVGP